MSNQVLIEGPPPHVDLDDANGKSRGRQWTIIAASADDAKAILYLQTGITRGSIYQNTQGTVTDPSITCTSVSAIGNPIAPTSGTGMYIVIAEYASGKGGGGGKAQAKPGGPAIWHVEPSLESKATDTDAVGNPLYNKNGEAIQSTRPRLAGKELLVAEWRINGNDTIAPYIPFRPYRGVCNLTTFKGAAKGCILSHGVVASQEPESIILLRAVFEYAEPQTFPAYTAVIDGAGTVAASALPIINPPFMGWADVYPHQGSRKPRTGGVDTDPPSKRYENIVVDGVTKTVNLNAAGNPADEGVYWGIHYMQYKLVDLNQMAIP